MNTGQFNVTQDVLATKWQRLGNHLIDLVPQYGLSYGLAYLFFYIGEFTGNYTLNDYWNNASTLEDYLISYALLLAYYFLMESLTNKTIGKFVTNTIVVLPNGEKPTTLNIFKRSLCRLIPFDALSFLGENGKGWHDSISNTYVVDVNKFETKKTTKQDLEELGKPIQDL